MTKSILYYFVDTNLFIQCQPLESLNWSTFLEFEEVCLIVSSPVLREIDHLKNRGNDRVGRQARKASAMFRDMLDEAQRVVHPQCPRVVLSIEPQHTCSRGLEEQLDLQERDDQLLGIVHKFVRSDPSKEVRLLTHDTTPLYKARGLGVAADRISDDWLRPPESTAAEKRMTALEAENARLKSAEPSLSIHFKDQSGMETESYTAEFTWFEPLTDSEIDRLMKRLKAKFPPATKFSASESPKKPSQSLADSLVKANRSFFLANHTYVPATDKEIEHYRTEAYPGWMESCEGMLRTHHRSLQQDKAFPEFTFLAKNAGTRPATDVLVTVEARGGFQIKPPPFDDDSEEQEDQDDTQVNLKTDRLPRPPVPPRGRLESTLHAQFRDILGSFGAPHTLPGHDLPDLAHVRPGRAIPTLLSQEPIDPNAFYYKPAPTSEPRDSFALECAQWRHDNHAEALQGEIHVPTDSSEVDGLLVCRIQAANLSQSVSSKVPVRIEISHISAFESAQRMVEALINEQVF